ncbi:hypothetical protein [Flavobacterium sp.]|uniref:hypothetical protein n=1 Tax=Flavobacterium sp. TaxID=239 RepID=UPI00374DFA94
MLTKNLPTNKLIPILFIRMSLDGIAAIRFLIQGKFTHFWVVLKAHVYFYYFLFKFLGKRDIIQSDMYYKLKSIVLEYFIRKNKYYKN